MRVLITLIFVICGFVRVHGQAQVVFGNGEKLVPLSVNATLLKSSAHTNNQMQKASANSNYFILDTLQLPFIDDFSSNWLKNYNVANYTLIKIDSICYSFLVDAVIVNSLTCSNDTTFTYVYDPSDSSITKTPLSAYQIINYNDPNNPFVATDTTYCYVPYFVYDTVGIPSPDTCFADSCTVIDTLILTTFVNQIDTLAVYGPDTIGAGVSLSLWIDDLAYINNTYAIDPITIGVATLDGVDESGTPHNNFSDPNGYGVADYLTSKPLDLGGLTSNDPVYLTFFYQPEGLGNNPQPEDSLVLEFYAPAKLTWHNIWSVPGTTQADFEHVLIPITSSDYFKKGFQFRFKNYATISGNFDHWHIDYVRLKSNWNTNTISITGVSNNGNGKCRYKAATSHPYAIGDKIIGSGFSVPAYNVTQFVTALSGVDTIETNIGYTVNATGGEFTSLDTTIVDVAFVYDAPSLVKNYEAIPWKHFLKDTINQLKLNLEVIATNNDVDGKTTAHLFLINDIFDSVLLDTVPNSIQLGAFKDSAYTTIPINNLNYICYSPANSCFSPNSDYAVLEIVNVLTTLPDDNRGNDTLRNYQRFYNYYAYDDGSAEAAYSLVGNGSKVAYRFTTITPDTIRAIDMFFAQTEEDVSSEFFYLTIWSSINPEVILYQRPFMTPEYEDSLNEFHTYLVDEILVLSGTYYIGFVQVNDVDINLGFDKNTVANSNLYYNTTGTWLQSIIPGAMMMRPLFGDTVIIPLGVQEDVYNQVEKLEIDYLVYPNPGRDIIYFEQRSRGLASNIDADVEMKIIDLYGRIVMRIPALENSADVSNLGEGLYFFEFRNTSSGKTTTKKIFITR